MMRSVRVVALVVALVALAGCTPLYVPPVPASPEIDEPVRFGRESSLQVRDGRLVAVLQVSPVPEPGWLTLQWYGPMLDEVASDSVWLAATGDRHDLQIGLPDHVELRPGRWRLVLAYRGSVIRQLDTVVTSG